MKQIVSRGHTRFAGSLFIAAYQNLHHTFHHKCRYRPLTEISFAVDGPNRTLLVSSAHGKPVHSMIHHTILLFYCLWATATR